MLQNPARKEEARQAKKSGEYTIAGPYELVQGGTGALLFEPVYQNDDNDKKQFWGFSILVLNWEKFMEETEINKLEDYISLNDIEMLPIYKKILKYLVNFK